MVMNAHRRFHYPYARAGVVSVVALTGVILVSSCSENRAIVLADDSWDASAPQGFGAAPDGATEPSEAGLTNYCPSNKCPADRVTCPNSRFPCDVNIAVDQNNCGACGFACPQNTYGSTFVCVDGTCQMECLGSPTKYLDCDGLVDNGCEVVPATNENCGACGRKCEDPSKPCIERPVGGWDCGCLAPEIVCAGGWGRLQCTDPQFDDDNCNGCGNVCDPRDGGGRDPLPNTYFGCAGGECQKYKCNKDYSDCDGDLYSKTSNGCEAYLWDAKNCGGCGNACPPGQQCQPDVFGKPICACPPGQTYCGSCYGAWPSGCYGECKDLSSDPQNCGACGGGCGWSNNIYGVCEFGSCTYRCQEGTADCNGNLEDFCEVNIDSDPNNCGACGNACDAIAGQACVHGRCAVEPCQEQEAGVPQ